MILTGLGASPGTVTGPVVVLRERRSEPVPDPVAALRTVADELEGLAAQSDGPVAEILVAQAAMAADPALVEAVAEHHRGGADGPAAVEQALRPFRDALAGARGDYQRQRVADLDELRRRALTVIQGTSSRDRHPPVPGILVAPNLSPADTALIPRGELLGIVSGDGGDLSHAAILARSLAIPAALGLGDQIATLRPGEWIAVDGDAGTVARVAAPANGSLARARERRVAAPAPAAPATADGSPVAVLANVGSLDEARLAAQAGAGGAGLVRTELVFADRTTPPTVAEQRAAYDELLDALPGPMVVRVLDAGSDKPLGYVEHAAGPNPALGERGLRLLLKHPELLRDQVRALCRCDHADRVRVMLPMVSRAEELDTALDMLARVFDQEGRRLPVGVMIEVPSAAIDVAALAARADFLSLGTNDLLQYLFAIDRSSALTRTIVEPLPASVWRLLESVIAAARDAGIEAGVCGELAADEEAGGILWALGASTLSVSPGRVASLARHLAARTRRQWHDLARSATSDTDFPAYPDSDRRSRR